MLARLGLSGCGMASGLCPKSPWGATEVKGFRLGVILSDLCFRRLFWLLGGEWTGGARGGAGE